MIKRFKNASGEHANGCDNGRGSFVSVSERHSLFSVACLFISY